MSSPLPSPYPGEGALVITLLSQRQLGLKQVKERPHLQAGKNKGWLTPKPGTGQGSAGAKSQFVWSLQRMLSFLWAEEHTLLFCKGGHDCPTQPTFRFL